MNKILLNEVQYYIGENVLLKQKQYNVVDAIIGSKEKKKKMQESKKKEK